MNHQPTYEQLIAGKLQELPIPDMADAIWARIEQQLDVDMPLNDQTPPNSGLTGFRFPGSFLSAFLIILVSVFLLWQKKKHVSKDISSGSIPIPAAHTKVPSAAGNLPERSVQAPNTISKSAQIEPVLPDSSITTIQQEASVEQPVVPATELPIQQELKTTIPPDMQKQPLIPLTDSIVKKQRGVKGISSDGYKIAPVKKSGGS